MTRLAKKYLCNWCKHEIKFDDAIRSKNDKAIPLNPDNTPHNCPESPFNKRKKKGAAA